MNQQNIPQDPFRQFDVVEMFGNVKELLKDVLNDQEVKQSMQQFLPGFDLELVSEMFDKFAPKRNQPGENSLRYLKELFEQGKNFNIYYKNDDIRLCVYSEQPLEILEKINVNGVEMNIREFQPFFNTLKLMKENWIIQLLSNGLCLYVLEFTDYFLEGNASDDVMYDMKKCIIDSKVLENIDTIIDIDLETKNKLRDNLIRFL